MIKVGIFSDLHLEHRPNTWGNLVNQIFQEAQDLGVDVLVNAGDTHHSEAVRKCLENEASARKIPYIDTLGNHDLYGSKMVHDEKVLEVSGLKFASTPLWTNFRRSSSNFDVARSCINDFRLIQGSKDMVKFHDLSVEFLRNINADVVVTHFAPHLNSIHPRYAGYPVNTYFVNDLEDLILELSPRLFVHGHVHDRFDYVVGSTRVVANPLGYPREKFNTDSNYSIKVVEV